jgi:Tol biopolymer transport system component
VQIAPLGNVRGDIVFGTRDASAASSGPITELWAIPIASPSDARVVLRYPGHGTPGLSSRLSPDGRQFAFVMDRGDRVSRIAIADLVSGAFSWLKTDDSNTADAEPVWDPSGARMAFTRAAPGSAAGVWVVNLDGSGLRQLVPPTQQPTYVHQWTPDGRAVAFYQGIGYDIVDVASGARVHMDKVVSADASWRRGSPSLLARGWDTASDGDLAYIFVADGASAARNVMVRASSVPEPVNDPRWRPGRDEFLYERVEAGPPLRSELRIRSLSGSERTVAENAGMPVWTPDGSSVVYIRPETTDLPGQGEGGSTIKAIVSAEIRVVSADGGNDRVLYRSAPAPGQRLPPNWCVCNDALAVRRY